MKLVQRVLCPFLAAAMLFGSSVLCVNAVQTFSDADQIVHVEAVNRAAELGYFVGSNGKFMPKDTVTRAQMATVIVKILHGSDHNADPYKNMGRFPDTADYQGGWADGYINLCVSDGVVSGYPDGTFQPDKKVTAAEAVTMILNAFKVNAGSGNWPDTVMNKGTELGLFKELTGVDAYTALNRDQLAALVIAGVDWKEEQSGSSEQPSVPEKPEETKHEDTPGTSVDEDELSRDTGSTEPEHPSDDETTPAPTDPDELPRDTESTEPARPTDNDKTVSTPTDPDELSRDI